MPTIIKAKLVRIGNSRGLRLPKAVLTQARLEDEVELELRDQAIVIRAARGVREGWDEQFRSMAQAGDDRPIDADTVTSTEWDEQEWQW
jgi:antitoxin MazE